MRITLNPRMIITAGVLCFSFVVTSHATTDKPSVVATKKWNPTPFLPRNCYGIKPWASGQVYNGGETVVYNGHKYLAKWWTTGDQPGVSDVWQDLGAC